jgi:hypothetical protein
LKRHFLKKVDGTRLMVHGSEGQRLEKEPFSAGIFMIRLTLTSPIPNKRRPFLPKKFKNEARRLRVRPRFLLPVQR